MVAPQSTRRAMTAGDQDGNRTLKVLFDRLLAANSETFETCARAPRTLSMLDLSHWRSRLAANVAVTGRVEWVDEIEFNVSVDGAINWEYGVNPGVSVCPNNSSSSRFRNRLATNKNIE